MLNKKIIITILATASIATSGASAEAVRCAPMQSGTIVFCPSVAIGHSGKPKGCSLDRSSVDTGSYTCKETKTVSSTFMAYDSASGTFTRKKLSSDLHAFFKRQLKSKNLLGNAKKFKKALIHKRGLANKKSLGGIGNAISSAFNWLFGRGGGSTPEYVLCGDGYNPCDN